MKETEKVNSEVEELSPAEVEEIVVKLAKDGNPPSKIGLILRDQYAVPSVKSLAGKSVLEILETKGMKPNIPEDLMTLIIKAVSLRGHLDTNKKDFTSKRSLEILEFRIRKLAKYYVRKGTLPADWKYEPEKAALLVR